MLIFKKKFSFFIFLFFFFLFLFFFVFFSHFFICGCVVGSFVGCFMLLLIVNGCVFVCYLFYLFFSQLLFLFPSLLFVVTTFFLLKDGRAALHIAARNGFEKVVKILVEHGSNVLLQDTVLIFPFFDFCVSFSLFFLIFLFVVVVCCWLFHVVDCEWLFLFFF